MIINKNMKKKIFIASDHAGFDMKSKLHNHFSNFIDLGTNSNHSVDYPDFAEKLTKEVLDHDGSLGILICGTGVGMSIAANRKKGIRAGLVNNPEIARNPTGTFSRCDSTQGALRPIGYGTTELKSATNDYDTDK